MSINFLTLRLRFRAAFMKHSVPLLLIDGNNLLYRAAYGFPTKIYNRQKKDITTVFAFFALLRIAFDEVGFPLSPIICFDGEHSLDQRRLEISSYKQNRINNRVNPYGDLPLILESLEKLSFPVLIEDRYESDDLIAHFVSAPQFQQPTFIMSSDKDFYQLVNERVLILNTMRKGAQRRIGEKDILEKFGVLPSQWAYYRALMGDTSDFIKGVSGVGPKTAKSLLSLSENELVEVLLRKYNISWDDFQKIVGVIKLDGTKVHLGAYPKFLVIEHFESPARVVDQLGLWK